MDKFKKETSIMEGKGEWDEADHPRDADGKFTDKGGGQVANKNVPSSNKQAHNSNKLKTKEKICKINSSFYERILGKKIQNKDVVIPTTNITHVDIRHGNLYEKYKNEMPDIINNPDYVFDGNMKDRVLSIKRIDKNVAVVLELSFDNLKFSNKVITIWEATDKDIEKYIRKRKLYYKKT